MRYLMTHSLLSSWLYAMKDNPYADMTTEDIAMEDFLKVLRREPTEQTAAMLEGILFEDMVTSIVTGAEEINPEDRWYNAANLVADRVKGGVLQYKAYKQLTVNGMDFLLHGRLDVLKAGEIIDIKFSKGYERGKYFGSTQHPMYFELVPEAGKFTYLVSNGIDVWSETYRRDEADDIGNTISDFVDWLNATGLIAVYKEKWAA